MTFSFTDARLNAVCDGCGRATSIPIKGKRSGAKQALRYRGWSFRDDHAYCPGCTMSQRREDGCPSGQ